MRYYQLDFTLGEVLKFQRPSKLFDSLDGESLGKRIPSEARGVAANTTRTNHPNMLITLKKTMCLLTL